MVHAQAKRNNPKILIVQASRKKHYLNIRGRAGGGYLLESARVPAEGIIILVMLKRFFKKDCYCILLKFVLFARIWAVQSLIRL